MICQSCATMLDDDDQLKGTFENGSLSEKYCKNCFENGKFTEEIELKDMAERHSKKLIEEGMDKERAKIYVSNIFTTLDRWRGERIEDQR